MLERLHIAFSGAPSKARHGDGHPDAVREIVRAHSHGNIRLQWGQYYFKKDVDAKFNRLREVDFVD